jgi:transcriptional regulator with XRE-family HTH domain
MTPVNGTPTPERELVAAEVRALMGRGRGHRRVSQAKLAADLHMAQASLSRRLTGEVPFDIDELAKIARYFGVPLGRLLGDAATIGDTGRLLSSRAA